jgi:peptidyl-prolyl cis-trans isomerase C
MKGFFYVFNLRKDKIMRTYLLSPHPCGSGQSRPRGAGLICLAIFLAVFSLSCRPKSPEETEADKPKQTAPAALDADNIAVTVNGIDITESEIEKLIKPQLDMIAKKTTQLPPEFAGQYKKQLRQQALEQLILEQLLDEKAKEAKIVVSDEEAVSTLMKIISPQKSLSVEELKEKIESFGQSFDQVKQQTQKRLGYQKVMEAQWAGKINITDDETKKYYDENPKKFETPEQVRASHILTKLELTDPNTDPNEAKAKAREKTQDLLKQIKDGADFAELAKAHSTCPSAASGGDLDFFPRGRMAPAFEKAAFELEVGKVSDIVETEFGYHIIKVTDHKDAGVILYEQTKDNIVTQLTQKKQSEFAQEYIKSLKANANIVFPSGQ